MNSPSLSSSLSLSQSFLMNFGAARQPQQTENIKNNHQNVAQNRLIEDSYKPSKPASSNGSTPVNTSMQKPNMSFSRSESINLQFTTKEGDVVTISFNRSETRGSGALNKEQATEQSQSYKSNSNLSIENGLNKAKQQSLSDTRQNKEPTVVNKQDPQPPINNSKVATPVNQPVKPNSSQSAELQNTPNNNAKVSNSANKLVANRSSNIQMEQGGNKLTASKEEKYTFESANKPNVNADKQNISPKPIKNTSSQSTSASIPTDKKAVITNAESPRAPINPNQPEKLQTIKNEASTIPTNLASNDSNAIHMQQSINKVDSDGKSYSFNSEFSLNIEGDINDNERQSIADLLQSMSQVAHDFFQGGLSNAFSHAQRVGFETDQIAGFSMDVNNQKSVQAVSAYQQTAMPEQSINTGLLSEASEFLSQAKGSMANTEVAVESFSEPKQSFTDMFASVGQLFFDAQDKREENNSGDMFLKMIENISSDLFGKNQTI